MHTAMGSGDRAKVIGMFVAVVVIAVGGIVWYFKVHQPATRLADAQAEIAAWSVRWEAARDCLLGKTPASSKVSEALAVRELSPDPFDRGSCTSLISQLTRGEAVDTRIPAVEDAWGTLDKAATKVGTSFISHVDPGGDIQKKPDPLHVALDDLETAYANLRKTAEMAPPPAPKETKPLPAAQITRVTFGGKRILSVQEPYITSRAGLLAFGAVDGTEIQLQFTTGKPPTIAAVGAGMQRAIPDSSWAARAMPDGVEVGQVDDKGAIATPTKLALPGPTQVLAVVGSWADGVVVFGAGTQMIVARGKAGTFTPDKPYTVRGMAFATDATTGTTTLAWADDQSHMQVLTLDPSALETTPTTIDQEGFPKLVCLTNDAAWMQYTHEAMIETMELTKTTHVSVPDDEHALMSCSPGAAIFYQEGSYRSCAHGECQAVTPGSKRNKLPVAAVPNGIVGVETRGSVLAIRKGGPTDHYAVPTGFVPLVAMTDGNVVDVLGWDADGLLIAKVSAR